MCVFSSPSVFFSSCKHVLSCSVTRYPTYRSSKSDMLKPVRWVSAQTLPFGSYSASLSSLFCYRFCICASLDHFLGRQCIGSATWQARLTWKAPGCNYLGKLEYFTTLNRSAIKGYKRAWFPLLTIILGEEEQWGRYNLPRIVSHLRKPNGINSMFLSFQFFKNHKRQNLNEGLINRPYGLIFGVPPKETCKFGTGWP